MKVGLLVAVAVGLLLLAPLGSASHIVAATTLPKVIQAITVGTTPGYNHFDAGTGETYVSNSASNNVSVIRDSTLSVIASVAVGTTPKGLDYDSSHGAIWVANSGTTTVSIINDTTHSVVATVTGLSSPTRPEFDAEKTDMWLTENLSAGVVVEIGLANHTVWKTLRAGTNTVGISNLKGAPDDTLMLVTNYGSANVTVFNTSTSAKVATITVGTQPTAVDCIAALDECAVANRMSNTLSIINVTSLTVSATVTVGSGPIGVGSDPATNEYFVTNSLAGTVSVVSALTNSVVTTLTVGTTPRGATAYDPSFGYKFISNAGSNNVSVISDGTLGAGGGGGGALATTSASAVAAVLAGVFIAALGFGMVMAFRKER